MKNLHELDNYRITSEQVVQMFGGVGDHTCGAFTVPNIIGSAFCVIASSGMGWEHVSVSLKHRCPTWNEMERIKRLFFKDTEVAMQLHVPVTDHINVHNYCLHLWRPLDAEIPLPPSIMVGFK